MGSRTAPPVGRRAFIPTIIYLPGNLLAVTVKKGFLISTLIMLTSRMVIFQHRGHVSSSSEINKSHQGPATGDIGPGERLGPASSKDTRESNAAEPLAGEADVFTTPRKDAIPASTVLDGASPAKIVAKRPGLCAKAVARKRARAGKKAAKKGADSDASPDDNEDDVR